MKHSHHPPLFFLTTILLSLAGLAHAGCTYEACPEEPAEPVLRSAVEFPPVASAPGLDAGILQGVLLLDDGIPPQHFEVEMAPLHRPFIPSDLKDPVVYPMEDGTFQQFLEKAGDYLFTLRYRDSHLNLVSRAVRVDWEDFSSEVTVDFRGLLFSTRVMVHDHDGTPASFVTILDGAGMRVTDVVGNPTLVYRGLGPMTYWVYSPGHRAARLHADEDFRELHLEPGIPVVVDLSGLPELPQGWEYLFVLNASPEGSDGGSYWLGSGGGVRLPLPGRYLLSLLLVPDFDIPPTALLGSVLRPYETPVFEVLDSDEIQTFTIPVDEVLRRRVEEQVAAYQEI